jgi:hypothetical protein
MVVGAGTPEYDEQFPGSLSLGSVGGSVESRLTSQQLPEHHHTIDVLIPEHSHTVVTAGHTHENTLSVEGHTHAMNFDTSNAFDDATNVLTDLTHEHEMDLDLEVYTDGPRQWDGSESDPTDLAHTHVPTVQTNDGDDTAAVTISGGSTGAPSSDATSEDGAHQHRWDIDGLTIDSGWDGVEIDNTDTHTHTVIVDAASKTDPDATHTHTVAVGGTGSDHSHTILGGPDDGDTANYVSVDANNANHTHSLAGTTDVNDATANHSHTFTGNQTNDAGAHQHRWDIDGILVDSDDGQHEHSVDGSALSAGAHDHTIDEDTGAGTAHSHDLDGDTTSEDGAHTHTVAVGGTGSDHSHAILGSGAADSSVVVDTNDADHTHDLGDITTGGTGNHTHDEVNIDGAVTAPAGHHQHQWDTDELAIDQADTGIHVHNGATFDNGKHGHSATAALSSGAVTGSLSNNAVDGDTGTGDLSIEADWSYADMSDNYTRTSTGWTLLTDDYLNYDSDGMYPVVLSDSDLVDNDLDGFNEITYDVLPGSRHKHEINSTDHEHDVSATVTNTATTGTLNSTAVTLTGLDADSGAHTHSIQTVSAGDATVQGGHQHELSVDITDASISDNGSDGQLTFTPEGAHDYVTPDADGGEILHTHAITGATGTIASDGDHTHDVDGTTTAESAGHAHTLTGDTEAGGTHTHTGNTNSDGAHTHTINGTVGNESLHTHSVDGTTGEEAAHAHPLSGDTSADGQHGHTLSLDDDTTIFPGSGNGQYTYSAGGHFHSVSGSIDTNSATHTHTLNDLVSDNESASHEHTLTGDTGAGGTHSHTGTTGVGAHTHDIDTDSLGITTGTDGSAHSHGLSGDLNIELAVDASAQDVGPDGQLTKVPDADAGADAAHTHDLGAHTHTISSGAGAFDLSDEVVVTMANNTEEMDHHHRIDATSAAGTTGATELDHYHVLDGGTTGSTAATLTGSITTDGGETIATSSTSNSIIGELTGTAGLSEPKPIKVMPPYVAMYFIIKHD